MGVMNARITQVENSYIIEILEKNGATKYNMSIGGTVRWDYTLKLLKDLKVKSVELYITDEYFSEDLQDKGFFVKAN